MKALFLVLSICCAAHAFSDYTVVDQLGRKVSLNAPAKRIVALAPHIVENLYSAGAGERIVGAVDYCDYPEAANHIPRVGAISAFSLEAIIEKKPDLVVLWHSGRGGNILEKLVGLGISVYASEPKVLGDVAKSIRDYGVLTGKTREADRAADRFESQYRQLKARHAQLKTVSAFYQVWNEPLQTLNGDNVITDVIELCGGENVFAQSPVLAPKVSVESVILKNPQVIIASGMGEERPDWLDNWQKWPTIRAVSEGNLFFVPPDLIQRHTVRILQGAELICEQLEHARARR